MQKAPRKINIFTGKLVFEDGHVKIANFKNGYYHGYKREWFANGKLDEVAYDNYISNGMKWFIYNRYGSWKVETFMKVFERTFYYLHFQLPDSS